MTLPPPPPPPPPPRRLSLENYGNIEVNRWGTVWAERGIVGRGILVDYHTWRLEQGKELNCFETSPIPLSDLKACLAAQGTVPKFGDILIVRSGA